MVYEIWDQQLRAGRFTSVTDYYEEGLPDRGMILLVQDLRREGIVTTESCSGHILPGGERLDGYLFLHPDTCHIIVSSELDIFTRVMKQLYPMPQKYELWWSPDNDLANVREAIRKCVTT